MCTTWPDKAMSFRNSEDAIFSTICKTDIAKELLLPAQTVFPNGVQRNSTRRRELMDVEAKQTATNILFFITWITFA